MERTPDQVGSECPEPARSAVLGTNTIPQSTQRMMSLKSFALWLQRRAENVAVALLSVMFATFIVQILARYVFNSPIGWSEEVIIATWLWTILWGAAFVLRETDEVRFDIIYSQVSQRTRRIFTVLTGCALIVLYGVSFPATYSYVSFMKVERTAYLHVPMNWLYSVFLLFSAACICRYCWLVYRALRGEAPGTSQDARPE